MSCTAWADAPTITFNEEDIGIITGAGHRECTERSNAKVKVRLRKKRFLLPDVTLDEKSETSSDLNIDLEVSYTCKGKGAIEVFTETIVENGSWWSIFTVGLFGGDEKVRSATEVFDLCN